MLCPVCDRGEPASDRLLALFVLHEALALSELETFHVLVTAWVAVARGRQPTSTNSTTNSSAGVTGNSRQLVGRRERSRRPTIKRVD
ncbi:DUF6300 family protein [Streptomyces sp. NPDC056231]|uniref:DUF6300 family protein n=1 Tax=Streptomyces sp. NPDC056231 TaxID=3345755 RepID=UPI003AAD7D11